jgi:dolichol-phosphate mannosyltransferase
MSNPLISIVSPVYGCKTCLYELYYRLKETLEKITPDFEIILVNDASPDGAWETIVELANKDKRVKGIDLSRNFGQHYAITAGIDNCKGEWVVIIDCDLQCDPAGIISLYSKACEGYDVVFTKRKVRKGSFINEITSTIFVKIYNYLTDTNIEKGLSTMNIANRKVIESIKKMREHHPVNIIFLKWAGFNTVTIEIEHNTRFDGKTTYTLVKRLRLAINTFLTFSDKPLRLAIRFGFYLTLISAIFILFKIVKATIFGSSVLGWASIIASIFFSTGVIVSVLGIIGLYIGKIFEEVKNRPLYLVKDLINL